MIVVWGRTVTADPKLVRLLTLTGWGVGDVRDHADERGHLRLRDYLAWTDVEDPDHGPE